MVTTSISGYKLGSPELPRAPLIWEEFEKLKATLLFGAEDVEVLRQSKPIVDPQVEAILDVWYGFVASTPQLLEYFKRKDDGQPDQRYLEAVRKRFAQWIRDTTAANYDQQWLDYQFEIGRRHHRGGKNKTDGANTPDNISLRYVLALTYPVTFTLRPFLQKGATSAEQAERMYQAWLKSVLMQVILWSYPYVTQGDF